MGHDGTDDTGMGYHQYRLAGKGRQYGIEPRLHTCDKYVQRFRPGRAAGDRITEKATDLARYELLQFGARPALPLAKTNLRKTCLCHQTQ